MSDRDSKPTGTSAAASASEAASGATPRERWQLGSTHRKVDAMERMRGVTRYTDDVKLPGMLH